MINPSKLRKVVLREYLWWRRNHRPSHMVYTDQWVDQAGVVVKCIVRRAKLEAAIKLRPYEDLV